MSGLVNGKYKYGKVSMLEVLEVWFGGLSINEK